jgi:hypothetical protein
VLDAAEAGIKEFLEAGVAVLSLIHNTEPTRQEAIS